MAYDETIYARFANGNLTKEEEKKLKSSGEWDELEKILLAVDNFEIPTLDRDKEYKKLKERRINEVIMLNNDHKKKNLFKIQYLAIAASVLLLVSFLFLFPSNSTRFEAQLTQTLSFELPDQSKVILNDGSNISYSEKEWDSKRVLNLTGEAYFNVISGNRFIVQTKNGTVEVLGTKFNVRSWGSNLYVECFEGKVLVKNGDKFETLVQHQSVNVVQGKMNVIKSIFHDEAIWTKNSIRIYEETFQSVIEELQRQYNVSFKIPRDDRLFSGSFVQDDLNKALTQVCTPMGYSFQIDSAGNISLTK